MPDYREYSDQELAIFLKLGDELAYTEIYTRYWPLLFRHARKMLHDEDEAMDIVQDIFTTLWVKSEETVFNTSLSSYLYTAVRNRTVNVIKKGKLREHYLDSLQEYINHGEFITDDQIRYKEFSARIEKEISDLPPRMQEIFRLSRHEGMSYKQIAQEMDLGHETVKIQIKRALKALRIRLGNLSSFLFIWF